jgi:hypothetical protein
VEIASSHPQVAIPGAKTVPPKPSVHTKFVLDAMESAEQREESRWRHVTESIDLLFAKVGDVQHVQETMQVTQEMGVSAMEQVLKDQAILAKQIESTGQAVAKLTLDRMQDDLDDGASEHSEFTYSASTSVPQAISTTAETRRNTYSPS